MSVILREDIGKEMFATKKSLVYRIRLLEDGKTIRIIYKHTDVITNSGVNYSNGNTHYYEVSFKSENNAIRAFNDILDKLNMSKDDNYINFSRIINNVKMDSNEKLLTNN